MAYSATASFTKEETQILFGGEMGVMKGTCILIDKLDTVIFYVLSCGE